MREAASLRVIQQLSEKGAKIVAYDPMAIPNARKLLIKDIEFVEDPYSAIKGADCSIIMTEWEEIRRLRPKDYIQHMKSPNIVDARKLYKPEDYRELNFTSIGLGPSK
jgi:UDPglucose 6-dehydrogenase